MADPQDELRLGPPPKWSEIVSDPSFIELPGEQKEAFRQGYRDKLLKPQIRPQDWPAAESRFDQQTKGDTIDTPLAHIGRKLWKGATSSLTMGPDLVELMFASPRPGTGPSVRIERGFGDTEGGAAVSRPVRHITEIKIPQENLIPKESFKRYRAMVSEATGTGNEKAAPGLVSGFLGNAAEFLGAGSPLSVKNIVTRSGTVGKIMQGGRELLSSSGAAGGMELAKAFSEGMLPDSPTARAFLLMAGGIAGGGALEMAIPTTLEAAYYRGKELQQRGKSMIDSLVAEGVPLAKANDMAHLMIKEVETFRRSSLGKEFEKALNAQPNAAVFAQEAREAASKIPGFKPNLAMQTGSATIYDAGLAAAKKNDYVAMSIATSQAQALRALNLYAESALTHGTKTAKEVTDEITKSALYKATKELEANQGRWTELQERLTSGDFFTKQDGEALIALRNSASKAIQKAFEEQYKGLYQMADQVGFNMNLGDFYADILRIESAPGNVATRMPSTYGFLKSRINKLSEGDKKSAELADLQARLARSEGKQATLLQNRIRALRQDLQNTERSAAAVPATMEEVHSFYKSINDDLYNSSLTANDARLLNGIKGELVGRLKETNEGVYLAFDDLNKNYRDNFINVFRKGASGRMVNETKFGLQTPEQDALKPYLSRKAQGRDEFKRVFGSDESAGQLVEQAMADSFAAYVKDKPVTAELVRRFAAQHKDFLEGFPKVQKSFADIESAASLLEKRADELAMAKDRILSAQVKTLLNSTEPEKVLLQNVKSSDFMNRLHTMAKQNPEAAQAFAYEYGKIVQGMEPGVASKFLLDHKSELKPIFDAFDPHLYDKLAVLSLGKRVYDRGWANVTYGMNLEPDVMKRTMDIGAPNILNKMWALSAGKTGNLWNILYVGSKYYGAKKMARWEHVLGDAFTNPEFVDKLMTEQYGPLIQEAKRQGVSIEQLVRQAADNPKIAESLKTVLNDVAKKGKDALASAKLGHSFQAHGYRVVTMGTEKARESERKQSGQEAGEPYWNPQGLRFRRFLGGVNP